MFHSQTIEHLLKRAITHIDRLDAELLLAHVLGQPREFLISHSEEKIDTMTRWKCNKLIQKRKQGIPLAYLTGHKEFYGLDFFVNKHTLIPRPDTELMVELVREQITQFSNSPITLIDIGTGSGCIPISLDVHLNERNDEMSAANFVSNHDNTFRSSQCVTPLTLFATDISSKALRVAKKNANKHNVGITFKHGNLLEPLYPAFSILHSKIVITANLPYLTQTQFDEEPSIQHEPHSALVAEKQGLSLYEELLSQMKRIITNDTLQITAYFEIDPSQTQHISAIISTIFPTATIEIKKDLAGRERVVKIVF